MVDPLSYLMVDKPIPSKIKGRVVCHARHTSVNQASSTYRNSLATIKTPSSYQNGESHTWKDGLHTTTGPKEMLLFYCPSPQTGFGGVKISRIFCPWWQICSITGIKIYRWPTCKALYLQSVTFRVLSSWALPSFSKSNFVCKLSFHRPLNESTSMKYSCNGMYYIKNIRSQL